MQLVPQLVQPLDRPFPWRAAALAVGVLALAELTALLVLGGVRLFPTHPAAATRHMATTTPARVPAKKPKPAVRPLPSRSRVSVLVLNGNGIANAAGTEATRLLRQGYRHTLAADASTMNYARSLVLFRPGWEREAQRLARDAGIRSITPLDGRLPGTETGYRLVLILGRS